MLIQKGDVFKTNINDPKGQAKNEDLSFTVTSDQVGREFSIDFHWRANTYPGKGKASDITNEGKEGLQLLSLTAMTDHLGVLSFALYTFGLPTEHGAMMGSGCALTLIQGVNPEQISFKNITFTKVAKNNN
ncbi:hypothetical protein [Pseudomonas vancouverensis]|uniref:Uncharacterized protein n=1 Tax=Pseudomonas vancouverensis TaxID=95300 RepID=A0A1H2N9S3_PSEVA|nr:hypothetical protein [Pseudomonas vancouverensis]KAB0494053.1 hypothetical protein F7R09_19955 [Pseudomonas vancouverensis]TDB61490.1 hypothetical protein EIY72_15605 [Pseudomonas vancouverensis]SDV02008.1 hypothetical protein SAMN05216558_1902 [Pseudomonas vancouverensis]